MKITGTKSYIDVDVDGKTIRILGELTSTPAFYAEARSIKSWNPPHEGVLISDEEKAALMELIMKEGCREGHVPIIFE